MASELFQTERISMSKDELLDYLILTYPQFFKGRTKVDIANVENDQQDTSKLSIYFVEVKV